MKIPEKQSLCSQRTRQLKRKATSAEIQMKKILLSMDVDFMFQKGFVAGNGFYICDFYLPKYKLCIEVDGEYHFTDEQKRRDSYKNRYLIERGFGVLRITNRECTSISNRSLLRLITSCTRRTLLYSDNYFV